MHSIPEVTVTINLHLVYLFDFCFVNMVNKNEKRNKCEIMKKQKRKPKTIVYLHLVYFSLFLIDYLLIWSTKKEKRNKCKIMKQQKRKPNTISCIWPPLRVSRHTTKRRNYCVQVNKYIKIF